jgi:hypothetical protein
MIAFVVSFLFTVVVMLVACYCFPARLTPDGSKYLDMAGGNRVPLPYHFRFLLPLVFRKSVLAWHVAAVASYGVASGLVSTIAGVYGLSFAQSVLAGCLFGSLPVVRNGSSMPVLVDGTAFAMTAATILLCLTGHPWLGLACALVGASVKETVPVFSALGALSFVPLPGLIVPLVRLLIVPYVSGDRPETKTPFLYARRFQSRRLFDVTRMCLPWGACLLALLSPSWPVFLSLAASYGLLFVTTDSTRVFQLAAIPVCVSAASVVGDGWVVLVILAHLMNPFQGDL